MTGRVQVIKGIEDIQFPHLFITEESNVTFFFALLSVDTLLQSDFKTWVDSWPVYQNDKLDY